MGKSRLEAFSDGVIAVIITIMVLELKAPRGDDLASVQELALPLLSYVISYLYIAIYWNNHHHMLHTVKRVTGGILWANLHLLFWLSLVPFATAWMAEHRFSTWPTVLYGALLVMAAISYTILQYAVIHVHGKHSLLATAIGSDLKGKLSILLYLTAIAIAFWSCAASVALYALVALIWLVPDPRIERMIKE